MSPPPAVRDPVLHSPRDDRSAPPPLASLGPSRSPPPSHRTVVMPNEPPDRCSARLGDDCHVRGLWERAHPRCVLSRSRQTSLAGLAQRQEAEAGGVAFCIGQAEARQEVPQSSGEQTLHFGARRHLMLTRSGCGLPSLFRLLSGVFPP